MWSIHAGIIGENHITTNGRGNRVNKEAGLSSGSSDKSGLQVKVGASEYRQLDREMVVRKLVMGEENSVTLLEKDGKMKEGRELTKVS